MAMAVPAMRRGGGGGCGVENEDATCCQSARVYGNDVYCVSIICNQQSKLPTDSM